MKLHPKGFGGERMPPEKIKQAGWHEQGVRVVNANDPRLSWPERELVRQLGQKLYGPRREVRHG